MPSTFNPNGPSKNRLASRAAKSKKVRQQKSAFGQHKIAKIDVARGARPGLLPNSGPRAKMSKKKARKTEKKLGHAARRQMEAERAEEEVEAEKQGEFQIFAVELKLTVQMLKERRSR